MVDVSTAKQRLEKQEQGATKKPHSNGFTHAPNGSKHDCQDAALAAVVKNGEHNSGFEPNSAPNQVAIVMSDNGKRADNNPDVTLTHFRPITEQNGTIDSNNTNNNSNSLNKSGLSMKGTYM